MTTETTTRRRSGRSPNRTARAILSIVIVVSGRMAAFIGNHQATMPQGRVETSDPRRCISPANSSKATSAARSKPTESVTVRAIGQAILIHAGMHRGARETPSTLRTTSADVVHAF